MKGSSMSRSSILPGDQLMTVFYWRPQTRLYFSISFPFTLHGDQLVTFEGMQPPDKNIPPSKRETRDKTYSHSILDVPVRGEY